MTMRVQNTALLAMAAFSGCRAPLRESSPVTLAAVATPGAETTGSGIAFTVDSAVRTMGAAPLWPHFDPVSIPLAVFDGRNTALFRHPHPPAEYRSLSRSPSAWAREGRDPAVTGNSSAPIDGVPAATVLLGAGGNLPPAELGALAIHELFHLYQRRVHPAWTANEVDLFTYPADDVTALALRREETFALMQARASHDVGEASCWATTFTALRTARFARIGAGAAAYERGTELNEGLAQYVELRSRAASPAVPLEDFPVDRIRERGYAVGATLAALLDQLQPGWREQLDAAPDSTRLTLDGMLARTVEHHPATGARECRAGAEQRARWTADAARDVDSLTVGHARARTAFLARDGWSLLIDAPASPLVPQRFDPLNVTRVSATEILHSRFVRLGRDGATIEVIGRATLSAGIPGQHPLFNGVRMVTITGLPSAPSMSDSAGVLVVRADGVSGRFAGARATTDGRTVRIALP